MRKFVSETELIRFFPEEADAEFEIGTVVKHTEHPDTTIGFVTRQCDLDEHPRPYRSWPSVLDASGSLRSYVPKVYEVEWSSAPPALDYRWTSGSIAGFQGVYAPYVPLQVTPTIFGPSSGSIRYSKKSK